MSLVSFSGKERRKSVRPNKVANNSNQSLEVEESEDNDDVKMVKEM